MKTLKICSKCKEDKPFNEYYPDRRSARKSGSIRSTCKSCDTKINRAYALKNPEYTAYRQRNSRLHHYGITPIDFDKLLNKQNGVCAACATDKPGGSHNQWHVDHDHACCSGKECCGKCIRGLLCRACNQALGLVNDDPKRLIKLIEYLDRGKNAFV